MSDPIHEYVAALLDSERLGRQVCHHRVLDGSDAKFSTPKRPWPKAMDDLLAGLGIDSLYEHQSLAADLVRSGQNVVVATPTASGKTLTYNLPVFEQVIRDPASKAIYLYPLKALAQDQLKAFNALAEGLPPDIPDDHRPTAAIYDGDTTQHFRKKIRENPPSVVMTNPEMLHLSLLPHHESWAELFSGLTHVIVDEVHTYRGVMGSHMAQVFRRLLRICAVWGVRPTFVFCSATVGNPAELCENLTGLPVTAITESSAAQSKRHMLFLNPHDGAAQTAILLLQAALSRDLRTIVYTQSRKLTELISMWASERAGEYGDRISAYRAGFLPEERRDIEARMSSGELLAVISTSALELGIDIGGLDLCILVGYPGSVMATMQRGGRVGRTARDSAVALIAQEDALDQYFMRHPDDFFSRPAESAVLNPHNPVIMRRHLGCAAAELAINPGEPYLAEPPIAETVRDMCSRGQLYEIVEERRGADGRPENLVTGIVSPRKRPHRNVDLRGSGSTLHIQDVQTGTEIGTIDEHRAYKETHPGAVYLHRGKTYVIEDLSLETRTVSARQTNVRYYTRVRGNKSTEILNIKDRRRECGTHVYLGKLRVTEEITGYEKRAVRGGKLLGVVPLNLPPLIFETEGIWFTVPDAVRRAAEDSYHHFMGAIHALEHTAIGILPLLVLTDRNDLGGISTPFHPEVGAPAVFIYDGLPGGAGLTRQAFDKARDLLDTTLKTIVDCDCELGCPSCVHSPKCGSGNRPMDKDGAAFVLNTILGGDELLAGKDRCMAKETQATLFPETPLRFGVYDLETRHSAAEVGGWNRANRMGISVGVLYDSGSDAFHNFGQDESDDLYGHMTELDLIIGFNIIRFDYQVLSGYSNCDFGGLPTLDLLTHIHERLGYRLKLDNLAQATLDVGKSADGLQALEWWKEGKLDEITKYCTQDVAVTRDLYLFGRENGHVFFTNKAGQKVRLPVDW